MQRQYTVSICKNACDSINEAAELGIIEKKDGHVSINIDKFHHTITIEDNGTGIKADKAEMTLKYIAHSKKKKESAAGFYGIGRLVGGGYCKQLSFTTSAQGEDVASEMVFDMAQIREILEDDEDNSSASEVIHKVTTFRNDIAEEPQKHYFKVVLKDILLLVSAKTLIPNRSLDCCRVMRLKITGIWGADCKSADGCLSSLEL